MLRRASALIYAVDVKPILADRFPIERLPEALELAGSGDALRAQIQLQMG